MANAVRVPITNVVAGGDFTGEVTVGGTALHLLLDTGSSTLVVDGHRFDPSTAPDTQTTNLVHALLHGGFAPATAGNPRPFGMPPFVLVLDDADIAAVLTHLRTAWGNTAPEVTELEVNRVRAAQAR